MNGIILSAGRGSRLSPYTDDRPKCLVEIDGITLLQRQIKAMQFAGVKNIVVVSGWNSKKVKESNVEVIENFRWNETSMVDSLLCARDLLLKGITLVSYGDIIYTKETALNLANYDKQLVIAYDPYWLKLWSLRFDDPISDAETFKINSEGIITEIGQLPRSLDEIEGQYMGLLRFTPAAIRVVERVLVEARFKIKDMTSLLQAIIKSNSMNIYGVPSSGPWCEIDQPKDLLIAKEIAKIIDS